MNSSFSGMMTARKADFDGHSLAYQSYGVHQSDEALVFVHGWTCSSALWYGQQPLITSQRRSVLVDVIGHGNSDKPRDFDYGVENMARGIKAVLDHAGLAKVVLVAHSMGGPLSTMLLRLFSAKGQLNVLGIVYVDSFLITPEQYLSTAERQEVADAKKGDDFRHQFDPFWTSKSSDKVREEVVRVSMSTPEHVRTMVYGNKSLPYYWKWDEQYRLPALEIVASSLGVVKPEWKHHMPELEVHKWEGYSHFCFMEDPGKFNAEVQTFLSKHNLLE